MDNVRRESRRHFWNQKGRYLKDKVNEPATHTKNENIRDIYSEINELKNGY
jgi:hypothetical protein